MICLGIESTGRLFQEKPAGKKSFVALTLHSLP